MTLILRDVTLFDLDRCLELNNSATPAVPQMERSQFGRLIEASDYAFGVVDSDSDGDSDSGADARLLGFVLTMLPGRDYDSENYRYFSTRSDSFLYIDRIVVDGATRGAGLGRMLYDNVFDIARAAGLDEVTCEVNVVPPNPESLAFHRRMGFVEVGRQATKGGAVEVALLAASVARLDSPDGAERQPQG